MRLIIVVAAVLAVGCVKLGHIQQTQPVSRLEFTGSSKTMAQCIQRHLGGKSQESGFGATYVIYNAVKGDGGEGLTHYSMTIGTTGTDAGFVEWRVVSPPTGKSDAPKRELTEAARQKYWQPVEACAAETKR